ncbi:Superfamily I DNA or RNA helicase [Austwickia chelonae]|uniref:DNA 3'-5' helicase n=1 Tax=Austwickia chelonae NBRC 105200 TaxID=1184607 RepID=K6VNH2_9MICO|nr:ATP-dependent DNA helicase [Austwickia chelonae]GAB78284.1 putative ATP-dependent DNA helicase [Austwickia chelonae NBRC 105200]SEW00425.1 Superfamily I DNA or RNA helicase [Austwickia chelonae]
MVQLHRPAHPGHTRIRPATDPSQQAAAAHRGGTAAVLGAAGTGKTTTAEAAVLSRIDEGHSADHCLVLAHSRTAAAQLRERISAAAGLTSTTPTARTIASLAFAVLRAHAVAHGAPPPRLLSGPEQDAVLRELLAGHAQGIGTDPGWPTELTEALTTRGFRTELRDLLMRAAEGGLGPDGLAELGRRHHRPEWVAAARVADEYDHVTALSQAGAFDPAALLTTAVDVLDHDPALIDTLLPGLRAVIVDDAHELTPPGARLLTTLTRRGVDLLLIGDPDAGTEGFRGGDPRLFLDLVGDGPRYILGCRWRQTSELATITHRVTTRIGAVGGTAHRRPTSPHHTPEHGRAEVLLAHSAAQEARLVAEELRRAHLLDGVPWSQMAVLVRGSGRTATLRRVLTSTRIPVVVPGAHIPLAEEAPVAAILTLLRICLAEAQGDDGYRAQQVVDLLSSPLGGMDAVALRRLRRRLRSQEIRTGRGRPTDEALVRGILGDGTLDGAGPDGESARRLARALAAGREAAARTSDGWAPGVTAETVLWALWQGLDLADTWRSTALDGGPAGARADRDLDAMVALFGSAATYVDRLPGRGPDGFLEHITGQDVAGDMLTDRAPSDDAVHLTTPAGAAGQEWDLVAICGVQEGVWPDLRIRGSVLGSQQLSDLLSGRPTGHRQALAAVRYDETRLFHVAVSRARRRLLVTAVSNEEEQPSGFVDLVDPVPAGDLRGREVTAVRESTTPAGVVARLRRELARATAPEEAAAVARRLILLAAEGFQGADPAQWWALTELSDDRERRPPEATVQVSPSRVEAFGECGLRWLLTTAGGDRPRTGGADAVGSLVHDIAAESDNTDAAAMQAELDRRWPELGLPPGWISERRRVQARDMLGRLAGYQVAAEKAGWHIAGCELAGRITVGRAEVRGRVDRIECSPDGGLRIVDLKTGAAKRRQDDLPRLPQLGVYQVLVEEGAFDEAVGVAEGEGPSRSAGAALLQIGSGARAVLQEQPPLQEDEDPSWAHRLLDESAQGMAAAHYRACVGSWCRSCPVRGSCPVSGDGEVV